MGKKKNKVYDEETAIAEADKPFISCCGATIAESGLIEAREKKVCGCPRWFCLPWFFCCNIHNTPFLLLWHFFCIFELPFWSILFRRIIRLCCCCIKKCQYVDLRFPASDDSIGEVDIVDIPKPQIKLGCKCLRRPKCSFRCIFVRCTYSLCRIAVTFFNPNRRTVRWKRAAEFKDLEKGSNEKMHLFSGGIEANDVCQGALGDCWLLAAIATIAEEHPDQIKNLFQTREADACGCYQIKLYDENAGRWRTMTIDDRVPVNDSERPYFTSPNGNEIWVLLLEKAFARMRGSYGALQGGHPSDALTAFTGNKSITLRAMDRNGSTWTGLGKHRHSKDEMWHITRKVLDRDIVACAGTRADGKTDRDTTQGISHKHAYTVLDTYKTATGTKLIQLRNPWGHGEWTGAYSGHDSNTKSWIDSAGMSLRGKKIKAEDGMFWMPWDDFCKLFTHIDFCVVTKSVSSLHLDVNEDMGFCGPFVGLLKGWFFFYCLCQGLCAMWRPNRRSTRKILADAGA